MDLSVWSRGTRSGTFIDGTTNLLVTSTDLLRFRYMRGVCSIFVRCRAVSAMFAKTDGEKLAVYRCCDVVGLTVLLCIFLFVANSPLEVAAMYCLCALCYHLIRAHTMGRLFNLFSLTYVSDNLFDGKFDLSTTLRCRDRSL